EMVDDLGLYALTYTGVRLRPLNISAPELISRYAWAVRGVFLSNSVYTTKAEIIHELTEPVRMVLFGGKRHWVRRIKALIELPKILDKYAPPDTSRSAPAVTEGVSQPDDSQSGRRTET